MDRYFLFLFWSNVIFGITIFLFKSGFLLSRDVLPDRTLCTNNESCYPIPKQTSKAIVLLIDALRYDFTLFDEDLKENDTKPYQNAMPIISKLIKDGHGKLYESYADPPTTTMQRLKGLTTGSIPTFIGKKNTVWKFVNFCNTQILREIVFDTF